jgi:uncharacterized protein YidB (DUF937 family)
MCQLAGDVENALGSGSSGGLGQHTQGSGLLPTLVSMLTSGSGRGLAAILGHLIGGGFAEIVCSWLSTGPNQPVTGERLRDVLPSEMLSQLAAKAGVDPSLVAQGLAQVLPSLVDRLSPNGTLLSGSDLQRALAGFEQVFSGNG